MVQQRINWGRDKYGTYRGCLVQRHPTKPSGMFGHCRTVPNRLFGTARLFATVKEMKDFIDKTLDAIDASDPDELDRLPTGALFDAADRIGRKYDEPKKKKPRRSPPPFQRITRVKQISRDTDRVYFEDGTTTSIDHGFAHVGEYGRCYRARLEIRKER